MLIFSCWLLCACSNVEERVPAAGITAGVLARHIKELSSDAYEGRAPSSPGEEKTVRYIAAEFEAAGLAPGNGGSYFQPVPLVAITASVNEPMTIQAPDNSLALVYRDDMMLWTKHRLAEVSIRQSELVFVGYGIVAPEYGWDDYRDTDVRGKTVLILVNDPGFATRDPTFFNGNAMTYYGRWTYKFEEAARQGAEAALVIHQTRAAGYPWDVVSGSWSGKQFDLANPDRDQPRSLVEGWLTRDAAESIFGAAGLDYGDARRAASGGDFRSFEMGLSASLRFGNHTEFSVSRNVVGLIKGRRYPEETVIFTTHWDHMGTSPELDGDNIFNGAVDNASGTAGLLVVARAFARQRVQPDRSIVFLAVTAEESGLLGSAYYAGHPLYPLETTVAALNMDGINVFGRTRDVTVVGYGSSGLEDYLQRAASAQNRVLRPESSPEKGFFYRSDHFNFSKRGVPVLYAKSGIDHVEHGVDFGRRAASDYTQNRYHRVDDEYDPNWDLSGAVEDLELYFDVAWRLGRSRDYPEWVEGNEFKAIRDASAALRK